jgi:glycosyltransferase involved in cell wall biosynthesis
MNRQPSVCVMIPVFNQAAFVTKAIETALQQDYDNLTVLVSDDCSADNTSALIAPYLQDKRLVYSRNQTNIGRVANYRKCLYELAESDWVINLDGDDYFSNQQFISQAIAAITKYDAEEVLFYQGSHGIEYATGIIYSTFRIKDFETCIAAKDYVYRFSQLGYFSHMSLLYNRRTAMQSGFYEKDVLSTDIYSVLKLCINNKSKKAILSKNISGMWVQHGANASSTKKLPIHLKNIKLYMELMFFALKKGFNFVPTVKNFMIMTAQYIRVLLAKRKADAKKN